MIAKDLRVSERSVQRWRRAWREGRMAALTSAGPPNLPKLSDEQFAEQEKELGPAVHGWENQRWPLARIRVLIAGTCRWTGREGCPGMLTYSPTELELGFGSGQTCRRRLGRWHAPALSRSWHRLLPAELHAADALDWIRACVHASHIHASHIRAKKGARPPARHRSAAGRRVVNTT
ncbi:helix-turn-helix domain-containing protein [Streptomyces sp. NPDC007856]|uniref:helix-turn-helix domain-containing protein n=1 Tax=Streptomyces sp. NPDC007856 TaxID=3364781 RepID=UPI0036974118